MRCVSGRPTGACRVPKLRSPAPAPRECSPPCCRCPCRCCRRAVPPPPAPLAALAASAVCTRTHSGGLIACILSHGVAHGPQHSCTAPVHLCASGASADVSPPVCLQAVTCGACASGRVTAAQHGNTPLTCASRASTIASRSLVWMGCSPSWHSARMTWQGGQGHMYRLYARADWEVQTVQGM